MHRSIALVLVTLLPFALVEAQPKKLTIEAIYGGDLSSPAPSQTRWTPEGHLSYFLSSDDGRDLWLFDSATFERRVLVSADTLRDMAPSPSQVTPSAPPVFGRGARARSASAPGEHASAFPTITGPPTARRYCSQAPAASSSTT